MHSRARAVLAVLSCSFVLLACEKTPVEQAPIVRPVKIQTIGDAGLMGRQEYPGTIRAFQNAEMAFEVPGRIIEFLVQEGDFVTEGDVLARLDDRDYQAQLKAAQASLRKAQADLNRSLSIYKEDPGAISQETIDRDRKAAEVAQAQVEVAEKAVEDTELRAPFSGRMARKLVEDFQNVQAKEPILILQDTSTLEIEVNVPERDIVHSDPNRSKEQITARTEPKVIVSALPDRGFPARVKEFATTADPVTRTFAVRLLFDNPADVAIMPGMTARVQITVDRERAWSVPVTAAQADESGNAYVWRVDESTMTVSRAPVELGDMSEEYVHIESGLEEGNRVAVSGVTQLREGMQVRSYEP
ncbi:MAG: efflux RND transporter periplasmic adaptor subunit [Gammaproteobacteria bacterium]|nr:efflux RND transporter periplasmic adaptor subunit [Gammaproteobacteria bacterium]NIR85727.1 efflux RND transporter periplasmic adaptor subunit [Gammaproteobacteria bacterium]NIR90260.1 efflux RND transporter periplasmic adaptor subunit [Gammaproteobacteria bacterium]NIU06861.1 efflux RND transporter periplasmic adaptor subunit [Gammaproteobacteria bacterium]NIV53794.1 efflux RND transporter periplasmic adaptor subunit [Gammaproteobacteria bacterium]